MHKWGEVEQILTISHNHNRCVAEGDEKNGRIVVEGLQSKCRRLVGLLTSCRKDAGKLQMSSSSS